MAPLTAALDERCVVCLLSMGRDRGCVRSMDDSDPMHFDCYLTLVRRGVPS